MHVEFEFDTERAVAAMAYMAAKGVPELTTYKICKLLFWSDKNHLVKYGRPITGDRYSALPDGPIPSEIYFMLKQYISGSGDRDISLLEDIFEIDRRYVYPRFILKHEGDIDQLSESDIESLDYAISNFGHMDFFQLKAVTHETTAWNNAWNPNSSKKSFSMKFEDFFEDDPNAIVGAFEEMRESSLLRKALAE